MIACVFRWLMSWVMEESLKRWSNLELAHQYPLMLQYWVLHFFIWPWWCSSLWKWFCFAKTNILLTSSTSILLWFPGVWWWAFWHQHPPQVPPYEEVRQGWVTANFLIIPPISFFFLFYRILANHKSFSHCQMWRWLDWMQVFRQWRRESSPASSFTLSMRMANTVVLHASQLLPWFCMRLKSWTFWTRA